MLDTIWWQKGRCLVAVVVAALVVIVIVSGCPNVGALGIDGDCGGSQWRSQSSSSFALVRLVVMTIDISGSSRRLIDRLNSARNPDTSSRPEVQSIEDNGNTAVDVPKVVKTTQKEETVELTY